MNADNSLFGEHSGKKETETFYSFFNKFKIMCLLSYLKSDTANFLHLLGQLMQSEENIMSINAPSSTK